jgi:hypothetical protein
MADDFAKGPNAGDKYVLRDSGAREEFKTGAVRDTRYGKGRFDLLPPYAIRELAQHYEAGALKYSANQWRKGIPFSRLLDSAKRHINLYETGDRVENHLIAAVWNLLAMAEERTMIELGMLPKELDDATLYPLITADKAE